MYVFKMEWFWLPQDYRFIANNIKHIFGRVFRVFCSPQLLLIAAFFIRFNWDGFF